MWLSHSHLTLPAKTMAHLLIPGVSLVTDEHLFSLWLHRLHKMRDIAPGSDRPWVPAVELLALPPRHVTFSKSPSASMRCVT